MLSADAAPRLFSKRLPKVADIANSSQSSCFAQFNRFVTSDRGTLHEAKRNFVDLLQRLSVAGQDFARAATDGAVRQFHGRQRRVEPCRDLDLVVEAGDRNVLGNIEALPPQRA